MQNVLAGIGYSPRPLWLNAPMPEIELLGEMAQ